MDTVSIWENPFVAYLISPAVALAIVLFIAYKLLDLGVFKEKFARVLKDIEDLNNKVGKLLNHMAIIKTHLVDRTGMDANLFGANSPLRLLPKGKELLKKSGFKKIYTDNQDWFIRKLKKYKVKSLYDLDQASLNLISECQIKNKFANYKEIAFKNGVTTDVLSRVISIWLRDETASLILKNKKLSSN